jgi:hypothetical protein
MCGAAYYSANLQLQNFLNSNVSILLDKSILEVADSSSHQLPASDLPVVSFEYLAVVTVVGTVAVVVLEVAQLVQLRS